jgi:hypothetical protein
MEKTWKPTAAGVLGIISTVFVLGQGFGCLLQWHSVGARVAFPIIVIAGILGITGGIFALRRKIWVLALVGSICASLSLYTWFLGIMAIIFVVMSKSEFR